MSNPQLRTLDDNERALDLGCRIVQWVQVSVFLSGWIVAGVFGVLLCLAR